MHPIRCVDASDSFLEALGLRSPVLFVKWEMLLSLPPLSYLFAAGVVAVA